MSKIKEKIEEEKEWSDKELEANEPEDNYEFDEEKHIHKLNGKRLTGCTTVLGVVAKPALIQWSADMACDFFKNNLENIDDIEDIAKQARTAHRLKKEKAGGDGTAVHEIIEGIVELWIDECEGFANGEILKEHNKIKENLPENIEKMVTSFVEWAVDNEITFLESEKNIYSKEMWTGGIVDLVFERNGKTYIGDIKTSKSIYPEYFWQCAGYDLMLDDMKSGYDIDGYTILKLKNGFEEKTRNDTEENKEAFKACLTIYRQQQKLKPQWQKKLSIKNK